MTVLLVVGVFVQKAHALEISKVNESLAASQAKTSKIESQLKNVSSEKAQLATTVSEKDARIQQLEQENADLK